MAQSFRSGPEATAQVENDPFWSVVRRRHPDVDIVVLPPVPDVPPAEPPARVVRDEASARFDARAAALWLDLLGDVGPSERRARWIAADRGAERYESTWRLEGADPVGAVSVVDAAAATLRDQGWQVLAPPDGMPRVLAGRDADGGRDELQLVLAPAEARLVMRLRSAPVWLRDTVEEVR